MSATEFFYTDVDLSGNTLSNSEITNSKISLEIVTALPVLGSDDGVFQNGRSVIFEGKLHTWTVEPNGVNSPPILDPDKRNTDPENTWTIGEWNYSQTENMIRYKVDSNDAVIFIAYWDVIGADTSQLDNIVNINQNNIEALQNDVSGINGNVSELQAGLANINSDLATNATAINTEKERIDAVLLASDADKDSFAEVVALINQIDTENDDALFGYKQSIRNKNTFNAFLSSGLIPFSKEITTNYNEAAGDINEEINSSLFFIAKTLFQALFTPPTEWDIYNQEVNKVYYNEGRFMINDAPVDPLQNYLAEISGQNRAMVAEMFYLSEVTPVEDIVALALNSYNINIEFEDDNGSNLRIPYKRVPTSITSDAIWSDDRDEKIRVPLQGRSFDWKEVSLFGKGIDSTKQINIKLTISPTISNAFLQLQQLSMLG